ncbi:AAA family ATPase [Pseudomonas sp. H11T01]|uniref:AAA family ATPase n=1 Tax=Pseudomonas sp. H11T01 TaxID=3402749 RepID=UPI003ACFBD5C
MLKTLHVKNVKCFSDTHFNFSPMTVFAGANSAGKSTALQCLLLLRQSFKPEQSTGQVLAMMGELFSVGHAKDLINHTPKGEALEIEVDDTVFSADLKGVDMEAYHIELDSPTSLDHPLFNADFNYLSALRLAPQISYDVNYDSKIFDVGIYGQFAVAELMRRGGRAAPNQRLAKKVCAGIGDGEHEQREINLEIAFKEAMKTISPDFNIVVSSHTGLDKVSNTFASQGTAQAVRPVNTGFGISYVMPIIVAALCTSEGGFLLVENPEVHLHPAAQSVLAGFLTQAAVCGIQVILETHSDHIINGIRVFIRENKVPDGLVTINSVRATANGREVTEIIVEYDGALSDMDEGFLDQAPKDLLRLF